MPFQTEHMLLQWGGTFANSSGALTTDGFVGSMRFAGPGISAADNQQVCDRMGAALRAWWLSGTDNFIPYTARLQWVKWNRIGTDGKYASPTQTRLKILEDAVTANAAVYPQQICWAVTWMTQLQRGRGHQGRTFFPTNVTIDPEIGMRVPPAAATKMATKALDLIGRLNYYANTGGVSTPPDYTTGTPGFPAQDQALRASVMSSSGTGIGIINRARVGNRLDIQRRRDNSQEEIYVSTPQQS